MKKLTINFDFSFFNNVTRNRDDKVLLYIIRINQPQTEKIEVAGVQSVNVTDVVAVVVVEVDVVVEVKK